MTHVLQGIVGVMSAWLLMGITANLIYTRAHDREVSWRDFWNILGWAWLGPMAVVIVSDILRWRSER